MRGSAIVQRANVVGRIALLGVVALASPGCAKIRARDLVREGNVAYAQGRFDEAMAIYGRALEFEPDAVTVLWNRACAAEAELLRRSDLDDAARSRLADRALADFAEWLARLPEATEEDRRVVTEHRLSILAADRRCDELVAHWTAQHEAHPDEEAWYGRIVRQYEACERPEEAEAWRRKRTDDFPTSARAWHQRAIQAFEPLWPPEGAGVPYNPQLSAVARLRATDRVLAFLARALEADRGFRDAYTWRAMAYSQRRYARTVVDAPDRPEERLEALRAREDTMLAWMQLAALCHLDGRSICEPPPLSAREYADDHVKKLELVAELAAAPASSEEP